MTDRKEKDMKKIIVLMLTIALCVASLTSCGFFQKLKSGFKSPLDDVAVMYENSAPTKVVATTKQSFKSYELNSSYELITGQVDGMTASVYIVTSQELESLASAGGTDIVKPLIKTTTSRTEAIDGVGSRTDGGPWNAEGSINSIGRGAMAINLDKKSVTDVTYENHVLTFTIPNANIGIVLGESYANGIVSDVKVTIVDDGAVITSIELHYTLAGNDKANLPESEMVVKVEYTYDIEQITIA